MSIGSSSSCCFTANGIPGNWAAEVESFLFWLAVEGQVSAEHPHDLYPCPESRAEWCDQSPGPTAPALMGQGFPLPRHPLSGNVAGDMALDGFQ